MTITKIISSGAFGAESAALDVAIRLKIPYGGFTQEGSMVDGARFSRRYKLHEKQFQSEQEIAQANLSISDGTLIFTRGAPDQDLQHLINHAEEQDHPLLCIDFNDLEPLQAAFRITMWVAKNELESLSVTGSANYPMIYTNVYDTLYSALILGKEEHPEREEGEEDAKPLPKTVDEAVQILIDEMPLKDKVIIANMSADEVGGLNLSLGNFIRNRFELWSGNKELLWSCSKDAGKEMKHPDDASAVIIARLALALEKSYKLRSV